MWFRFLVAAATLQLSLQCANMPGNSECGRAVVKAMTHDFVLHPDRFIGLSVKSSYTEFQAYFHNADMHACPRPCLRMEQACVPWSPNFPGVDQIAGMHAQMEQHPNWWPELSSKSSDKEIAKALYTRGTAGIPRVCEADEAPGHHVDYEEAMSQQAQSDTDSVMKALQEEAERQRGEDGWGGADGGDGGSSRSQEFSSWSDGSSEDGDGAESQYSSDDAPEAASSSGKISGTFGSRDEPAVAEEASSADKSPEAEEEVADEKAEKSKEEIADKKSEKSKEASSEDKSPEEEVADEKSEKSQAASSGEKWDNAEDNGSWLDSWKGDQEAAEGQKLYGSGEDTYDDHPSRNDDSGNYGHRDSWRTQGTPTHHVQHVYHRIHTWSGRTTDADTYAFDGSGDSSFESGYEDGDGDRGMEVNSCNHKGRSFSMLDVPEHVPQHAPTYSACKVQCAKSSAGHVLFHEPTQLCHCPPKGAMVMQVGEEFIGGDVHCASEIMGKSDVTTPNLSHIGLNASTGMVALGCSLLAAVFSVAACYRKVSRADRLGLEDRSGFARLESRMVAPECNV